MAGMSRAEATEMLHEGQSRLDVLMARISDEEMLKPGTIGGGDWSTKDLMGHIAYWEEIAMEALGDWRASRRPSVEEAFGRDGGVDELNARNQERTRQESLLEVRERARRAHEVVIETISGMTDADWDGHPPYATERRRTLGVMLGAIMGAPKMPFGHAFAHVPDLEAYVGLLGADHRPSSDS